MINQNIRHIENNYDCFPSNSEIIGWITDNTDINTDIIG